MLKIYFHIVVLICFVSLLIGFILPYCISSYNTEFVLVGLVLIIVSIPAGYYAVKKKIKGVKK